MRFLTSATAACALLASLAFQAQAQAQAQAQTAPATTSPAPAVTAPAPAVTAPAPKPTAPARQASRRQTLDQRFDAANTTHDGHLTKDQATTAHWPNVTRDFDAIDKDHKGFVSVTDIRTYYAGQRAARRAAAPAPASKG